MEFIEGKKWNKKCVDRLKMAPPTVMWKDFNCGRNPIRSYL